MTEETTAQLEIKILKEELKWLEETLFWIGRDGMPNMLLVIGMFITGILPMVIIILIHKFFKKRNLRKQIFELKGQLKMANG